MILSLFCLAWTRFQVAAWIKTDLPTLLFSRKYVRIIPMCPLLIALAPGCQSQEAKIPSSSETTQQVSPAANDRTEFIEDFDKRLVIKPTVFWEPLDTTSLRKLIRETRLVRDKKVLEIGTGSGLVSLCCIQAGASEVVATDVNVNAVECANLNAKRLGLNSNLDIRLVNTKYAKAFAVIPADERFDLIISNPPWEEGVPKSIDQYALYDPSFELLKSLLHDAPSHLNPGGELYLAYGCKTAIKLMEKLSVELDYEFKVLDDRKLDALTEVFLPGMLIKLVPKRS